MVGRPWWPGGTLLLLQLLHSVECTASAEPLDLGLVEGVVQEDGLLGPVGVLDDTFQGLQERRQVWVEWPLATWPWVLLEGQEGRAPHLGPWGPADEPSSRPDLGPSGSGKT